MIPPGEDTIGSHEHTYAFQLMLSWLQANHTMPVLLSVHTIHIESHGR